MDEVLDVDVGVVVEEEEELEGDSGLGFTDEESESEGPSVQRLDSGVPSVTFNAGKAAFGEGSGMLKYESSKISSWAPSKKLYKSLYTGGENGPSKTLFLSACNQ